MKQTYLKSFCARFLTLLVLALLSTNYAWGAEETVTLGPWNSKPISGSTSNTVTGTLKDGNDNEWSISLTGEDATKNPSQSVNTTNKYWQLGANGNKVTAVFSTSAISGTIKSIVVDCAAYNGKGSANVTVGEKDFGTQGQTIPKWSDDKGGTLTFSGSASGEIKVTLISSSRAIYIRDCRKLSEINLTI